MKLPMPSPSCRACRRKPHGSFMDQSGGTLHVVLHAVSGWGGRRLVREGCEAIGGKAWVGCAVQCLIDLCSLCVGPAASRLLGEVDAQCG